ncbi:peptidylprolyl isomerase [Candidatus Enterovibrio altilux]
MLNSFYDSTFFHRIIDNFIGQGSNMTSGIEEKELQTPIKNEANNTLRNKTSIFTVARTLSDRVAFNEFSIFHKLKW